VKAVGTKASADRGVQDAPATAVYERLRGLIVRGQLAPGARLVERDIADRLGTSRTPVRSALQRLQQERYVTVADGGKHARWSSRR
jgi:DNA-binding GntR family transcriptional regulator